MNIFKQFFKSIYSPKDIALFRFQGIGKTILYVFFLTLISILPTIYYLGTALSTGIDTAKSIIEDEFPSFSINNGQLSANTKVPITIKKDDFTIILDPTGAIEDTDVENEGNAFGLLKDQFVLAAGGQSNSYQYAMLKGLDLSKGDVTNFMDSLGGLKAIIIPVMSILLFLFSSAASFVEVSVLALVGLVLVSLSGRKLAYRQLWRMAAYSETLPTLFFTIMAAIKTSVPHYSLINWFVVIIVLYLAINETPRPKKIS